MNRLGGFRSASIPTLLGFASQAHALQTLLNQDGVAISARAKTQLERRVLGRFIWKLEAGQVIGTAVLLLFREESSRKERGHGKVHQHGTFVRTRTRWKGERHGGCFSDACFLQFALLDQLQKAKIMRFQC